MDFFNMLEVNMSTSFSMKDFYIDLKEMKLEHNLHDMEILHNELNWCSMNPPHCFT
jgi:hypothetical protein